MAWWYYQTKNLKLNDSQKKAAVTELLGHAQRQEVVVPQGDQSYSNQYYSISYPKAATEYHQDPTYSPPPSQLSYFAFQEMSPRLFFTVSVMSRPGQSLTDITGVSFRQKQPSLYNQSLITEDGVSGLVFTRDKPVSDDNPDLEKTAFFVKDDRVYTFSLTGSDIDEINKMFDSVINSLKFN